MKDADAIVLGRVQVGLFTALAGALIARQLLRREDLCEALKIIQSGEPDERVSDIFRLLRDELSKPPAETPEVAQRLHFSVIQGDRTS